MYTISIRNSYDLKKLDLVELHGMLKTYELEMSQYNKLLNNTKKGAESTFKRKSLALNMSKPILKLTLARSELDETKVHIEKLESANSTLQKLLDSQINSKLRHGIGYNFVKPPVEYVPIPEPVTDIKLKFSNDPEPIEEAHNAFNLSSSESEYESTFETLKGYTPFYPRPEQNKVGISSLRSVKFVRGQTDVGSSSRNNKQKNFN
ncbi:hypothetical protein L1987_48727 [Smallanthus sonchifolius]|uniref:Uncharacterized protein n=1 Tax=Smallanthus sonchifolius TaxID=185202 RepID=A0ACB9FSJ8_9ASTR|nr:hypothetical protein L1987_48727 [Smallanthus sonchifolius]